MRWIILLALWGCGGRDPVEATPANPADTDVDTDTDTDVDTDTDTDTLTDARRLRDLLAGQGVLAEVVQEIAWSDGFPVREGDTVLFVALGEGPWSVSGDFNDWALEPMVDEGELWLAELVVDQPAGSRYKLVQGGTEWMADPLARSYEYDPNGQISFVRPPTDRPRLDRWPGVEAPGLTPRDLRVWVPQGTGPWPVLYAQDGQNLFDPQGMWGGWRLQDSLGQVDPMLVVGIDNTAARMDEYTHVPDRIYDDDIGGQGDLYGALVHEVVRPHIEAVYGSTGHDGLMGSSLGGLISLEIAWAYPGAYDFVACMSGTLGWGRFVLENEAMETRWLTSPPADTAVYVDSGGGPGPDGVCQDLDGDGFPEDDPDSTDNYCETRQFADALAGSGFTWDTNLWHWHEADALHNEAAWAQRVYRPLELFVQISR